MKFAQLLLILVLVFGLLVFSLAACDWEEPGLAAAGSTPRPGHSQVYDLTATYGAEQLHIQLTALAGAP
jgi:hypothetical protein